MVVGAVGGVGVDPAAAATRCQHQQRNRKIAFASIPRSEFVAREQSVANLNRCQRK